MVIIAAFALFGYILLRFGCEPAPMILGFLLGPLMEENLRRSLVLSRGDPMIFLQRPISLTLLIMTACVVALIILPAFKRTRRGSLPGRMIFRRAGAPERPSDNQKIGDQANRNTNKNIPSKGGLNHDRHQTCGSIRGRSDFGRVGRFVAERRSRTAISRAGHPLHLRVSAGQRRGHPGPLFRRKGPAAHRQEHHHRESFGGGGQHRPRICLPRQADGYTGVRARRQRRGVEHGALQEAAGRCGQVDPGRRDDQPPAVHVRGRCKVALQDAGRPHRSHEGPRAARRLRPPPLQTVR